MRTGRISTVLLTAWGLFSPPHSPAHGADRGRDPHSFGRPEQVRVSHVALDLEVSFKDRTIQGSSTLSFVRMPGAPRDAPLVLDTRDLEIVKITEADPDENGGSRAVPWRLGEPDEIRGRSLTIDVPAAADRVRIDYATTGRSTALQWVVPKGTAGGVNPFLFTQSQAIQARSWIPLQDSPGVRVTYEARVKVPPGLEAVMSAERGAAENSGGRVRYSFTMAESIPPYLIALAVGELGFKGLGPRTGVYAEPSVLAPAAWEFADTENMVKAAEARFGPYRWGRYDVLVLPPSFPFGGMENARLTFATPTVLAGDRSLVSLVAHELSHSWSGNLVTNATWRDFWLNEGFTTYLERRIVEDLYGPDRADMERVLGLEDLRAEFKSQAPRDQILHVDLSDRNPDEGMTKVPYEKGALFLTALERAFGRARFDAFLRRYFDHFAFRSITTGEFTDYLRANLFRQDEDAARSIDLHAWLEEPGLPDGFPEPTSKRLAVAVRAAKAWADSRTPAEELKTADWSTHEWIQFLTALPDRTEAARLAELDKAFGLTSRGNAEVAETWLRIAVRNQYRAADARLESFLTTIGRRKFLIPLYSELLKTPGGKARARAIYDRARPFYHPIAVDSVDKLLNAAGD